jgi:hypothetical protein
MTGGIVPWLPLHLLSSHLASCNSLRKPFAYFGFFSLRHFVWSIGVTATRMQEEISFDDAHKMQAVWLSTSQPSLASDISTANDTRVTAQHEGSEPLPLNENGDLEMYWIDLWEDSKKQDSVFLIGKVAF